MHELGAAHLARFSRHLEAEGYIARGGQIIDATIVSVPKQRNTKEENEAIKAGKTPQGWEQQPAKNAQKDKDARWTKRNDESFYGYALFETFALGLANRKAGMASGASIDRRVAVGEPALPVASSSRTRVCSRVETN